jgi:hypothetical protein
MRKIQVRNLIVIATLLALSAASFTRVYATGWWGWILLTTSPGTGLPGLPIVLPSVWTSADGKTTVGFDVTGTKGFYTAWGTVTHKCVGPDFDHNTPLVSATGWRQLTMGAWNPGTAMCQHEAPDDAELTAVVDVAANAGIYIDANNCDGFSTGECEALGFARVDVSGVIAGTVTANVHGWFDEGDTSITGPINATEEGGGGGIVTSSLVTTSVSGDVAQATASATLSGTSVFTGNIAGQLQKWEGLVIILDRANNGAFEASSYAQTWTGTGTLTMTYGGSAWCDEDEDYHEGHVHN